MNLKDAAVGFAIQADKDEAAAQPAFWCPVGGGALLALTPEQVEDELTSSEVGSIGEFRQSVAVAADYETRAWPRSIGGLLYAVLGAVDSTGADPYTHLITPDLSLPWTTVFAAKGSERKAAANCKLDELKLEWEGNGPLKVTTTWAGLSVAWSAVAYTPDLDEKALRYLKGIDLTAVLDLDGKAYDGGAKVLGGSLDIKRNLTSDIYSGELLPGDLFEGGLEIDAELKVRVPDLLPVRLLLTGSTSGADPSPDVPYGDFSLTFASAPDSLALAATRVAWKTSEPDADPKGGPGELTLQGRCYGATPLTATVINAHASY
jgi:hypothetical protein